MAHVSVLSISEMIKSLT